MNAMIVVTHLLGSGHLRRALTLGRAFAAAGHRVLLASGGMPAPMPDSDDVDMLQLPPLRSDGTDFTRLLDAENRTATAAHLAARRRVLTTALAEFVPDILLTELFPFGRRALSEEFLAVLSAARGLPRRPVVLASVRDILAPPSKPAKAAHTDRIIADHYDAVLVHSDPRATRLEQSWPVSGRLAARLRYTGYVAPPPGGAHPGGAGTGEILVSAGGGAVGTALFETAIAAARRMPDRRWRLLVAGRDAPRRIAYLAGLAAHTATIVEAARPDFRQMLTAAAASVSLCGYNTALDLLQAGTPAVLVPFDSGGELEQGLRAESLAPLPAIAVLRSTELGPRALAGAVSRVIGEGRRTGPAMRFDGAAQSVTIACDMARARP